MERVGKLPLFFLNLFLPLFFLPVFLPIFFFLEQDLTLPSFNFHVENAYIKLSLPPAHIPVRRA